LRLAAVTAATAVEGLSPRSPASCSLQLLISLFSVQTLQPAQAISTDQATFAGTDPLAVGGGDGGGSSGRGSVPAESSETVVTTINIRFFGSNTTTRTSYPTRPRDVRGDRPSCGRQRRRRRRWRWERSRVCPRRAQRAARYNYRHQILWFKHYSPHKLSHPTTPRPRGQTLLRLAAVTAAVAAAAAAAAAVTAAVEGLSPSSPASCSL
jgi:hypothetical protein